jgi:hypothetical protein
MTTGKEHLYYIITAVPPDSEIVEELDMIFK